MPNLSSAPSLYLGDLPAGKVYYGEKKVWPIVSSVWPVYDTFADVSNGNLPTALETGQVWGTFGAAGSIQDGRFDSTSDSASYLECYSGLEPITHIGARWRFSNLGGTVGGGGSGTLCLATWADGGLVASGHGRRTSCHVTVLNNLVQWYVRTTESLDDVVLVASRTISPALSVNSDHTIDVYISEGHGEVVIDGGTPYTWDDARIALYEGERWACWEPYYGGSNKTRVQTAEVWADGDSPPSIGTEPAFRAAVYSQTTSNVTSRGIIVPAMAEMGDLLLLAASWISGSPTLSGPESVGWTPVITGQRTGLTTQIWSKVAGPGDAGSTVTVNSTSNVPCHLAVWDIANIDTVYTAGVATTNQATGSNNITVPAFTPASGIVPLHIIALCRATSAAASLTPPSGMTILSQQLPGASGYRTGFALGVSTSWADNAAVGNTWVNTSDHYCNTFLIPLEK